MVKQVWNEKNFCLLKNKLLTFDASKKNAMGQMHQQCSIDVKMKPSQTKFLFLDGLRKQIELNFHATKDKFLT